MEVSLTFLDIIDTPLNFLLKALELSRPSYISHIPCSNDRETFKILGSSMAPTADRD